MITESLLKYNEYLDSDLEFTTRTRFDLDWDDDNYLHYISLIMDVIDDYKKYGLVPIGVMYFLTSGIDRLIEMISNPLFTNRLSKNKLDIVTLRIKELESLKKDFITGQLFNHE